MRVQQHAPTHRRGDPLREYLVRKMALNVETLRLTSEETPRKTAGRSSWARRLAKMQCWLPIGG